MRRNDQWIGGAVLIAIGTALLVGQLVGDIGEFVLLGIGIALLVLFAVSRNPGTLIGGGIVTGLGVGVLVASNVEGDVGGAAVVFGLGFGFLGVWLVGTLMRLRETSFWPLVPGTILVIVGAIVLAGSEASATMDLVLPAAFIAIGVIVLLAAMRSRGAGSAGGGTA